MTFCQLDESKKKESRQSIKSKSDVIRKITCHFLGGKMVMGFMLFYQYYTLLLDRYLRMIEEPNRKLSISYNVPCPQQGCPVLFVHSSCSFEGSLRSLRCHLVNLLKNGLMLKKVKCLLWLGGSNCQGFPWRHACDIECCRLDQIHWRGRHFMFNIFCHSFNTCIVP